MKEFNVTGTCIPTQHYMVDTTEKLDKIIEAYLYDYFSSLEEMKGINRLIDEFI